MEELEAASAVLEQQLAEANEQVEQQTAAFQKVGLGLGWCVYSGGFYSCC